MVKKKTILKNNIVGNRYGKLLVIGDNFLIINNSKVIKCLCDCGKKKYCKVSSLLFHNLRSCSRSCGQLIDITNEKHGKLLVLKLFGFNNGLSIWLCKCDCGNIVKVLKSHLKYGYTRSCGCIKKENNKKGMSKRFGRKEILSLLEYRISMMKKMMGNH